MIAELRPSIVYKRALFPKDSIGWDLFPDFLEGRERSSRLLTRPVQGYVRGTIERWDGLKMANVAAVKDLLVLSDEDVLPWLKSPRQESLRRTRERLIDGLDGLIMGPEDRFMQAIFPGRNSDFLVPPEQESIRRERITAVLESLPERDDYLIQIYFGISTFAPKSVEKIAEERRIDSQEVYVTIERVLKQLRHPSMSRKLIEWLP